MKDSTQIAGIAIGLGVLALVLYKSAGAVAGAVAGAAAGAVDMAGGAITGNNAITRAATNAGGESVTAYQGAGVLGTLGAGANAASGGMFASLGQWVGGKVYDLTHDTPSNVTPNDSAAAAASRYAKPPITSSTENPPDQTGMMSFYTGASFKDLSDPLELNPFRPLPDSQYGFKQ